MSRIEMSVSPVKNAATTSHAKDIASYIIISLIMLQRRSNMDCVINPDNDGSVV